MIYEGYGPHGIAFLVETATDNTNRTVANVRMYFNKCGGTLGNSGSVGFLFDHKCVFKFRAAEGVDPEELELEMIDLGVDEFYSEEDGITVYAPYESFGAIQKWLDDKGFEIVSGESVRIPSDVKELDAEGRESVEKLVDTAYIICLHMHYKCGFGSSSAYMRTAYTNINCICADLGQEAFI